MGRVFGVCIAGLAFVSATCGGLAVLDGPGDNNGSGGSTGSSSSRASSTTQGPVSVVSSTGGVTNCDQACSALYDCGLQAGANGMQLCQGFTGAVRERNQFVMDCVDTCNTTPALLALIDPNDCPGTISTLKSVSADFSDVCDFGL